MAKDRFNLLDLIIFACCIGDTDRHAKNFSLMLTDGGPRLAPGYDLMRTLAYGGITRNLAMKIAGKNRADYIERRHWERFAHEVGLSPAATALRVNELAAQAAAQVTNLSEDLAAEFPANRKALRLFAERIREQSTRVAANSRRGSSSKQDPQDETEIA